jgi:hypothetical protein
MHGGVMNCLALQRYGISAATKTPPGGVIVRKPGNKAYSIRSESKNKKRACTSPILYMPSICRHF